MGFADTLVFLGIKYDSEQAVEFAEKLASFIQEKAHQASEKLARTQRSSARSFLDANLPYRKSGCNGK